jgi:hypothetical protein
MPNLDSLSNVLLTMFDLLLDALRFIRVSLRPRCALAAESLYSPQAIGSVVTANNLVQTEIIDLIEGDC